MYTASLLDSSKKNIIIKDFFNFYDNELLEEATFYFPGLQKVHRIHANNTVPSDNLCVQFILPKMANFLQFVLLEEVADY